MSVASSTVSSTRKVAIFAPEILDRQTLIDDLPPDVAWHVLSSKGDSLLELTTLLAGYQNLEALYIVAHGAPARILLGNSDVVDQTLSDRAAVFTAVGTTMANDGTVYLCSCDVANGRVGERFATGLAKALGREVLASDRPLGGVDGATYWGLNYSTRLTVGGQAPFSTERYSYQLAVPADESYDDNANPTTFNGVSTFTQDGVRYTIIGTNGTYDSIINNAGFLAGGADLSLLFDINSALGVSQISIDIGGGAFQLSSIAFDGIADSNITLSSSAGGNLTFASNNAFVGQDPLDLSGNSNFQNVTSVTFSGGNLILEIDDLNFEPAVIPNSAPTLGGTPGDATVAEDTANPIDLSAYDLQDADGDTITLTLAVDRGTIASTDGNGTTSSVTVASSGSGSMTLQGTAAALNTYLNNTSKIEYITDSNDTAAATLTVTPNDGTENGTTDSVAISVTPINDSPAVSGTPSDVTVTEDTQSNIDLSAMSFADVDGDTLTVTLTASAGTFATPADGAGVGGGVTETLVNGTTITLVGAAIDIGTYLDTAANLQYTPAMNVSGQDQATITLSASDGNGGQLVSNPVLNVDVTAVNDAPVFTALDGTPAFTEGGAPVGLDTDVTVADGELGTLNGGNGDFAGATLTIARNGGANAVDQFTFDTGSSSFTAYAGTLQSGGQTFASFTSTGGTLTVNFTSTGTATTALVNEVLQAITYANSSDDPAATVNLDWAFTDGDGGNDTGSTEVSITNVNDAPSLTATGQNPTYIEGNGAQDLFNAVTATTVETTNTANRFDALTLTVANVADGTSEILRLDGSDVALTDGNSVTTATNGLTATVSVSGGTATVNFTGASLSEAQLQTLVDGLSYRNTSDNPTIGGNRVVTITRLTDTGGTANGGADSATPNLSSTVALTGVNDAPVTGNLDGDNVALQPGAAARIDQGGDATVTNVDSADCNGGSLIITDNGGNNTANGNFSADGTNVTASGDVTIAAGETIAVGGVSIGTVDATDDGQGGNTLQIDFNADATNARVQTLLQNLRWGAAAGTGAQTFTATLNDADGTTGGGDQDTTANFTMTLGNPPVLANLNGDTVAFTEGDSQALLDQDSSLTLTDIDNPASLSGGNLTATVSGNAQAAEDQLSLDTSGAISLAGTTAGSNVSVSGTIIGTLANNIAAGNDLVVNLNANATLARVESVLGALAYTNNGELPTTSARTIDVTVTDNDGLTSDTAQVTVNVASVNNAPVVTGVDATPGYTEDGAAVVLDGNMIIADAELDAIGNYNGATLTLQRQGGADASDVFAATGSLSALTEGQAFQVSTTNVGNVTTNSNGTLTLAFNANATPTLVNSVLQQITYANTSETAPGAVTIDLAFNDGNNGNQGTGGALSDTDESIAVSVTSVNDAPTVAVNNGPSVRTGNAVTLTDANLNEGDPDDNGGELTYTLSTLPTSGTLSLNGAELGLGDTFTQQDINDGLVSFRAGTTTGNVSFGVTLADGGEDGAMPVSDTMTVTVTSPPPPPAPEPEPESELVDGVEVTPEQEQTEDGDTVNTIVIQPVPDNRSDTDPTSGDADIPLHFEDGNGTQPVTVLTLPTGIGAIARANDTARSRTTEQELLSLIRGSSESETDDLDAQLEGGSRFLGLAGNDNLWVNRITLQREPASDLEDPIRITGQPPAADSDFREALVIDGSSLGGGRLELNNIEFAVIVGDGLTLSGGAGNNTVFAGSGSQTIILGEGDDQLHGGAGNDTIGSTGGNDRLFGEQGSDTLLGGEGEDLLHGGQGFDIARLQGQLDDYVLAEEHGITVVQQKDTGYTETLVNIEAIEFEDQTLELTPDNDLAWVTALYDSLMGRQADLGGVQHWVYVLGATDSDYTSVLRSFLYSPEFERLIDGSVEDLTTNEQVNLFYQTLLQRDAEPGGLAHYSWSLENGNALEDVAAEISLSDEAVSLWTEQEDWAFLI
jgi:hypothetical protein